MSDPVDYAITYHVEAERETPSGVLYREIGRQVELADRLGFAHAWFAEHHGHAHIGHCPHPLAYATYLAARTERIGLGAAVVCVNLHHPVLVAEQIAMLDVLSGGRASVGLGSGSTSSEFALYGVADMAPDARRARFVEILDLMEAVWTGEPFEWRGEHFQLRSPGCLPRPLDRIPDKLWIGANSPDSARLAGARGYGLQLSNLRTIPDLRMLIAAHREGRAEADGPLGTERIAASAPLYVAESDARALDEFGPALEILLRENRRARPDANPGAQPRTPREQLQALRFTVGSPARCVDELLRLREQLGFTTLNLRPRWGGMTPEMVESSLRLFAERVRPELERAWPSRSFG
ncbi:MAG TPA: LLM class flavin-dependent oxidoreductase [Chloroflexota bacterium]|nr:LLM class flavin-dependent oxidoreductase [Chloroflexota bacterium]